MLALPILLTSVIAWSVPSQGEDVTKEQFRQLIGALHGRIHDVSFVFEGKRHLFTRRDPHTGKVAGEEDIDFQGSYVFRTSDSATLLEYFRLPADGSPHRYYKGTLVEGKLRQIDSVPDLDAGRVRVHTTPGGPGSLSLPPSPESYVQLAYFHGLDALGEFLYQFQGWEEVDGHPCLKVEINRTPRNPSSAVRQYWIDMERGGHPLRMETYHGNTVTTSVEEIRLKRFQAEDGQDVWLPVHATIKRFDIGGQPVSEETNYLVAGTIRINRGLPDDAFQIEAREVRGIDNAQLSALRRDFADAEEKKRLRIDPESIEDRLNEQLALAEAQATQLDASAAARVERTRGPFLIRSGLLILGLGLIIAAATWWWRAR